MRFATGTIASPCGTASAPPEQKSFCASTMINMSCRDVRIACMRLYALRFLLGRRRPVLRHQRAQVFLDQCLFLQEQSRAVLEDMAAALEDRRRAGVGGPQPRLYRPTNVAPRGRGRV